jgi:hypothetical protein
MRCAPLRRPMPWRTMPTVPRCRSGWDTLLLPRRGSLSAGRADLRRVRHGRWRSERAHKQRGNQRRYHPEKSASFCAHHGRRGKEDRGRQSVVGMALLVVGAVLIMFGMQALASVGSRLSALFTGAPSDRTVWLVAAGVAAAMVGLGRLLAGRRRTL